MINVKTYGAVGDGHDGPGHQDLSTIHGHVGGMHGGLAGAGARSHALPGPSAHPPRRGLVLRGRRRVVGVDVNPEAAHALQKRLPGSVVRV